MFFDKINVDFNANVVRINTFTTKSNVHGAFITTASQNGKRTVYIKSVAWGQHADDTYKIAKRAKQAPKGKKKIHIFGRLAQYTPKTQHGDRIQTIMPVIKKINRVSFTRKDNNVPASSANHSNGKHQKHGNRQATKSPASIA